MKFSDIRKFATNKMVGLAMFLMADGAALANIAERAQDVSLDDVKTTVVRDVLEKNTEKDGVYKNLASKFGDPPPEISQGSTATSVSYQGHSGKQRGSRTVEAVR